MAMPEDEKEIVEGEEDKSPEPTADDEMSILKQSLADKEGEIASHKAERERLSREMSAMYEDNSRLKNELAEMHAAFKNKDVDNEDTKSTAAKAKELLG